MNQYENLNLRAKVKEKVLPITIKKLNNYLYLKIIIENETFANFFTFLQSYGFDRVQVSKIHYYLLYL